MRIIFYLKSIFIIAKAYVPPHLRGKAKPSEIKTKLHEDDEKPDKALKIKLNEKKTEAEEREKKIKVINKVTQKIYFNYFLAYISKILF